MAVVIIESLVKKLRTCFILSASSVYFIDGRIKIYGCASLLNTYSGDHYSNRAKRFTSHHTGMITKQSHKAKEVRPELQEAETRSKVQ